MALSFSSCSGPAPLSSAFQTNANRAWRCARRKVSCGVLETIRQNLGGLSTGSRSARESRLLQAIQETRQGQSTTPAQKADILAAVEELVELGLNEATASSPAINATWKLLWTTEKVQLTVFATVCMKHAHGREMPPAHTRPQSLYRRKSEKADGAGNPFHSETGKAIWD